jgi:hypothetical protein
MEAVPGGVDLLDLLNACQQFEGWAVSQLPGFCSFVSSTPFTSVAVWVTFVRLSPNVID